MIISYANVLFNKNITNFPLSDSKKQSYNLQVMQHLPLPATGTAYPLGSWHHRGSPPSVYARIEYQQNGEDQRMQQFFFLFSYHFILSEFKENGLMHRTLCILKLAHPGFFFNSFVSQNFKKIRCLLHRLCERRCFAYLLHCISILLKM